MVKLKTNRMDWPLPAEGADPWYDAFVSLFDAVDASGYATREDRMGSILMGGGTVSLAPPMGGSPLLRLTWSAAIEIPAPLTGFRWDIAASNIDLADGEYLYVTLVRAPSAVTTLTLQNAQVVPANDNNLVVGLRRGDRVYFGNGDVIADGESLVLFPTGGGGSAAANIQYLPLALNEQTVSSSNIVVGEFPLNADAYNAVEFRTVYKVTDAAAAAHVELYNVTDASLEHDHTGSDLTTTTLDTSGLALPSGIKLYQVRMRITPNTPGVDTLFMRWAGLILT